MRTSIRTVTLFAATLLSTCAAAPAFAQTKDQQHAAQELARLSPVKAAVARYCATNKPAAYVCGAPRDSLARAIAAESLYALPIVAPAPTPTPVVIAPAPDSSVAQTGTPSPTPAPSSAFVVPAGLGGGVAAVAELPRDTAATPYPAMKQQVRLSLIANLQSALNNAQPGDEILLPAGSSFTGDFMLPKHAGAGVASCTSWIVVRTDVPDSLLGAPGVRMTPSRARALSLAKIQTPDNQQAIGSAWGVANVGCWRLVGLEILPGPTGNDVNGLVRFGDQNETDSTRQAHHLVIDRSYIHGSPTPSPLNATTMLPGQVRRCVIFNSRWNVMVDSYAEYCRGGSGDTQTLLGYAGTGPYRVSNSHLSGGTEVIVWGGANGGIVGAVPSDITVHGNVLTRELADTVTLVKTLYESKNSERSDVAGNVLRLNWPDGQDGSAVNAKSVNQSSGPCTWCHTGNFTFRGNRVTQTGTGLKLAGIQEAPALPAGPYTVYGNYIDSLGFRDFKGEAGRPIKILSGGLSDVTIAFNTIAPAPWGLVEYDGPTARQAWQSNVLWCGGYGAKGPGASTGAATLTLDAPGMVWTNNTMYGCGSGYPSGSTYSASLTAAQLTGAGADPAKLP